jgi:hypothetical protein
MTFRARFLSALAFTGFLLNGSIASAQGGLLGGAPPPAPAPGSAGQVQIRTDAPVPRGVEPTVTVPRVSTAPTIDGLLDDDVWADAVRLTQFTQRSPVEGAPASENTEVYIAYDSSNLYFGFYAHYADPGLVRANRSDRDQFSQDDTISVYFDPFLDQQRAYVFTVNGFGVQGDSILGGGETRRGTHCSTRPATSSRTAGPRRWQSHSRACGTPHGAMMSRTAGGSRSPAP